MPYVKDFTLKILRSETSLELSDLLLFGVLVGSFIFQPQLVRFLTLETNLYSFNNF